MIAIKKLVFSWVPAFSGRTNYIKLLLLTRHLLTWGVENGSRHMPEL